MTEKRFLVRCKISPGFFGEEVLVLLEGSSAYVNREDVKVGAFSGARQVDGHVYVYVIRSTKDKALVELPGQPVVGGARTWVPKSRLAATA